jgi:hypothetical protein
MTSEAPFKRSRKMGGKKIAFRNGIIRVGEDTERHRRSGLLQILSESRTTGKVEVFGVSSMGDDRRVAAGINDSFSVMGVQSVAKLIAGRMRPGLNIAPERAEPTGSVFRTRIDEGRVTANEAQEQKRDDEPLARARGRANPHKHDQQYPALGDGSVQRFGGGNAGCCKG